MYLLLLISLIGAALSVPVSDEDIARNVNYEHYSLPGESYPTFYDVRLILNPDMPESFSGDVSIRIIPVRNTNEIVIQAMAMEIRSISATPENSTQQNIYLRHTQASDDTHFLTIRFNTPLVAQQAYLVHISYVGQYAENMFGIYLSTYEEPGVGAQ